MEVSYNYRQDYLKRHKGILGKYYICPYCGKIIRKEKSHIDHIIAKKNSEFLFNRRFNTIAACPECNLKKNDKFDHRVVQGYVAKVGGAGLAVVVGNVARISGFAIKVGFNVIKGITLIGLKSLRGISSIALKSVSTLVITVVSTIFSFIMSNLLLIILLAVGYYLLKS